MLSLLGLQSIYAAPTVYTILHSLYISSWVSGRGFGKWCIYILENHREDELYVSRSGQMSWFIACVPESGLVSTLFQKHPRVWGRSGCNICHSLDCQRWFGSSGWLGGFSLPPSLLHVCPKLHTWPRRTTFPDRGGQLFGQGCTSSSIPLPQPPNKLSKASWFVC